MKSIKSNKRRVLLVTQTFYPENFKSNDIAFELVKRGYEVDALVSIPNYPEGVYYKGYGLFKNRRQTVNGVNVYRVFQTPRGRKASGIGLSFNYLTYMFSGLIWGIFYFVFKRKYDSIFVFQTSPVTQAIPAILIGKLRKIPIYTWVLDIWPDSVREYIPNKFILRILGHVTDFVYKMSRKILISSPKFAPLVSRRKNFSNKTIYFPNWSEDLLTQVDQDVVKFPDNRFIIMYAGSITGAQDIGSVSKTILYLKNQKDLLFVFLGDGAYKSVLEKFVHENGLEDIVLILGRKPANQMSSYFKQANLMLVSMEKGKEHLDAVVPARVQSFMSAAKPIVAMATGGIVQVIQDADCGYTVPPADWKSLATKIMELKSINSIELEQKGLNGRNYYTKNFTMDLCLNNLEHIMFS